MHRRLVFMSITCVLVLYPKAPVVAERQAIDVGRSRVIVHVLKSGMFSVFADDHVIVTPVTAGFLDDSTAPSVEVHIDARQMRVIDASLSPGDREAVQRRMLGPEVLDADHFPDVWFRSTTIDVVDRDHWMVRGNLTLHGHTHAVAVIATYEAGRYRGSTMLRQRDFGIKPVSIAGGAVKVKDELQIEFDIAALAG